MITFRTVFQNFPGDFYRLLNVAQQYHRTHGSNYFDDLIHIHTELGLSVQLGNSVAYASLVSSIVILWGGGGVTRLPSKVCWNQPCEKYFINN